MSGWYGLDPVDADLFTFGKVMGGGMPTAAFGGRAELMAYLAPAGPVYQAGTLSGNPVAVAAGLATLRHCDSDAYATVDAASSEIARLAGEALSAAGVPHHIQHAGNLFSVFFTDNDVRNYDDARTQDTKAYARFFHTMLSNGVYLPPSSYEAWFVSAAHDANALDRIATALPIAARAAADTLGVRA